MSDFLLDLQEDDAILHPPDPPPVNNNNNEEEDAHVHADLLPPPPPHQEVLATEEEYSSKLQHEHEQDEARERNIAAEREAVANAAAAPEAETAATAGDQLQQQHQPPEAEKGSFAPGAMPFSFFEGIVQQSAAECLQQEQELEAEKAAAALLAQEQQEQAAIHEDEGMSNPVPVPLSPEAAAAADQLLDSLASTEMVSLPPHPSQHSFPQAGTAWPMQRRSVLIGSNPAPKTASTLAKTPVATSGPATNAAAATLVPLFPIYYQPTQAAPWQVPPSQVSTTNFQFTPMLEHPQATIQRNNHQIIDDQNYKSSSMRNATTTVVPRSVSTTSVRDNRHQQYSSKPQLMPQLQPLRQPRQAIAAPRTLFGTVLPLPTTARTVTPLCPAFLSAASAPHTAAVAAPVVPEYFAAENDDLDSGLRIDDSTIGTICDNSLSFNRTTFFEKDNDDEDEESGDKYLTRTPPPHDQDVLCGRGGGTNNHSKLLIHYACAARYINPIAPR